MAFKVACRFSVRRVEIAPNHPSVDTFALTDGCSTVKLMSTTALGIVGNVGDGEKEGVDR